MELQKILDAIINSDRKEMIETIKEFASDEFETVGDVFDLAIQTEKELRATLLGIYNYYI
jgi:hypothetical protein